jgi:hypothetical protein
MTNAIVSFSYDVLAPDTASRLRQTAEAIRESGRHQINEILATGRALIEAKAALLHGQFRRWLSAEFGWSERTARNYMRAAEVFGSNRQRVADLPVACVYRLAALPPSARLRILDADVKGENEIATLISQHRLETEREAKESPDAKARKKARQLRAEQKREKHKAALKREESQARQKVRPLLRELDDFALDIVERLERFAGDIVLDEIRCERADRKQALSAREGDDERTPA